MTAHEYDDDGVCIHCGFDGAEWRHLKSIGRQEDPIPPCTDEREWKSYDPNRGFEYTPR